MTGEEVIKMVGELNDLQCGLEQTFQEFAEAYGIEYNEVLDFMTTVDDDDVDAILVNFKDCYNQYDCITVPADVFGDPAKVKAWSDEKKRKAEQEKEKEQQERRRDEYLRAKQCVEDYERKYGEEEE